MEFVTIWNMAKRYIAAAIVGALVSGLAALGITEMSPELAQQLELFVNALLMAIFYIVTILFKTWRQKALMDSGEVVPERV